MKNVLLLFLLPLSLTLFAHSDDDAVLGIRSNQIGVEKAQKLGYDNLYGSRVSRVLPGSAASAAGLRPLDYIYRIDALSISQELDIDDILDTYEPGDKVTVFFIRNGAPQTARLVLNRRGDLGHPSFSSDDDPFLGVSQRHERSRRVEGVPVDVADNSTAQAMGLEDGDILTAIDDYPIFDWHDLSASIDNRQVGEPIKATYYRDGEYFTRSRPIKSRAATHNSHSRANGPQLVLPEPENENSISEVELVEVSQEEAEEINEKKEIDMPVISNLQINRLNIFPNPNSGIFDIQFELPERGQTAVRIFNSAGQPVYFNTLGNFSGTFSDRIDIANGVKGIYFLEVRQDGLSVTRKVVLQ